MSYTSWKDGEKNPTGTDSKVRAHRAETQFRCTGPRLFTNFSRELGASSCCQITPGSYQTRLRLRFTSHHTAYLIHLHIIWSNSWGCVLGVQPNKHGNIIRSLSLQDPWVTLDLGCVLQQHNIHLFIQHLSWQLGNYVLLLKKSGRKSVSHQDG